MFQTDFSPETLSVRRNRIRDRIGPDAVAVIQGAPKEGGHELFRQTNDFYYLCGVEVPHSYLTIDGGSGESILFLPHRSNERKKKEGALLSPECAEETVRLTGVDAVLGPEALIDCLSGKKTIYTLLRAGEGQWASWDTLKRAQEEVETDPWDSQGGRTPAFVDAIRERVPADICDLGPIQDALRLVKTGVEIDLVCQAGKLTAAGVVEAMRSTKPGVMEYQLDAVMRYVYLNGGARDAGYRAIIAGGDNAWYGHYNANDQLLRDGDLVLVDSAPDYKYYTSDIGRMWPVSGTYSEVQRELYGFIVAYHKVLLELIRPSALAEEICREAAERMKEVIGRTRFSKPIYETSACRALEKMHLTHPVGMAVHDVGHYRDDPLVPGLLITVDPMMWIPEELKYIRVEDTLLITESGFENVTVDAPLELDEVEATMKEAGMVQHYPAV